MAILISPSGQKVWAEEGSYNYNDYLKGGFTPEGASAPQPTPTPTPTTSSNQVDLYGGSAKYATQQPTKPYPNYQPPTYSNPGSDFTRDASGQAQINTQQNPQQLAGQLGVNFGEAEYYARDNGISVLEAVNRLAKGEQQQTFKSPFPDLYNQVEGTTGSMPANQEFINAAFKAYHGRDANAQELANFTGKSVDQVKAQIKAGSPQSYNPSALPDMGGQEGQEGQEYGEDYFSGDFGTGDEFDAGNLFQDDEDSITKSLIEMFKNEFGLDLGLGDFGVNPEKTVGSIVEQVMTQMGLPDIAKDIETYAQDIQTLENERDTKISEINANPWISEGLRSQKVARVEELYADKINNKVNYLQLLENNRDDARQNAQFAATMAYNAYQNERTFRQDQLEFLVGQAEKLISSRAKAGEVDWETRNVGGSLYRIGYDENGNIITQNYIGPAGEDKQITQDSALQWALAIRDNKTKLTEVPNDQRGAVVEALNQLPPDPKEIQKVNTKILELDDILNHPGLNSSVGPTKITRDLFGIKDYLTGDRKDFIGKVERLLSEKALKSLIDAKAEGATFGALSEGELKILEAAASTLRTWQIRDNDGNVVGYKISEEAFKDEINRIKQEYESLVDNASQEIDDPLNLFNNSSSEDDPLKLNFNQAPSGGAIQIPDSSRLAYVNNNPGNLRYAGQAGAVEGEGGFARFNSPEAGYNALKNQIKLDASRGLNLRQFIFKYAPPIENASEQYLQQVINWTGANENTPINQIDLELLAQAIARKESSTVIV